MPSRKYAKFDFEGNHQKLLEKYNHKLSDNIMSKYFKTPIHNILRWRCANKLPPNACGRPRETLTPEQHDQAMELYKNKKNDPEISKIMKISKVKIYYWRRYNNLEANYHHNTEQPCWTCKNATNKGICPWVRTLKEQPGIWEDYKKVKRREGITIDNKKSYITTEGYQIRECKLFEVG